MKFPDFSLTRKFFHFPEFFPWPWQSCFKYPSAKSRYKNLANSMSTKNLWLTLWPLGNFSCFFVVCWFFFEKFFQEYHLSVKQIGSKSGRCFFRHDLGQICLRRLSADNTSRLGNFHAFCRLLIYFQNQLFRKILSGIPSECQTDWTQIRPDIMLGLIWVQSVCKGYQ